MDCYLLMANWYDIRLRASYLVREGFIDNIRLNSDTEKTYFKSSRKHRFSFTKWYYPILCVHGSRCERRQAGKEYGCSCWSERAQSIGWPLFLPSDWKKKKATHAMYTSEKRATRENPTCAVPRTGLSATAFRYLPSHRYTTTPNRLRHGVNYVREQCFHRD